MKLIEEINVSSKRVLLRADLNVPMENGHVVDDTRLRAALPTIRYLIDQGAHLILCSHLGRPGGQVVDDLRLDPVAHRLSNLLERKVQKTQDCIGQKVKEAVDALSDGDVLMLENTRFHQGEEANNPDFAAKLAGLAEVYVNDAFGTAHRAHASTEGVAHHLPAVAGKLMARELTALEHIRNNPQQPLAMVFGGAKVSDKIGVIEHFLGRTENLLLGGGMANTFLKAQGLEIGDSLVEEDSLDTARRVMIAAVDKLVLPVDLVIAREQSPDTEYRTVSTNQVPPGWQILDIGPRSVDLFRIKMQPDATVVWNGPMGVFEIEPFARGTIGLVKALAELNAETISGGGETAAAINQAGLSDQFTHVSTGGGAFLTFLEGEELPALAALDSVK